MNIATRTTSDQMSVIRDLVADPSVTVHEITHNLDGEWVNLYYTDMFGDWVCSIDKTGITERTQ